MIVLCSPSSETHEVGMYHVRKVHNNFYQATLKKFTGRPGNFPGMVLLWKNVLDWSSFPDGHATVIDCLVKELDKVA